MDEPQRYSLALPPRLADQLARELTLALAAVWLACVLALAWYVSHIVHHNFDQEMIDSGHRLLEVAVHQLEQEDHSREGVQRPHVASQPGDEAEDLVYQLQSWLDEESRKEHIEQDIADGTHIYDERFAPD
mgnify:CR=1 FL=1